MTPTTPSAPDEVVLTAERIAELRQQFLDDQPASDGPGAVSAFYTSLSFGDVIALCDLALKALSPQPAGVTDECWEWQGARFSTGYGLIQVDGKSRRAHRIVYEAVRGPIPEGLVLDHLCRNKACVNPWHLEAVTDAENILRGDGAPAMNARKTHCQNGHEFTDENTRVYRGMRICRICARDSTRERMRRHRAKGEANAGH